MSPVLTTPPETRLAPPHKPSRWAVAAAALLGYVISAIFLLIMGLAPGVARQRGRREGDGPGDREGRGNPALQLELAGDPPDEWSRDGTSPPPAPPLLPLGDMTSRIELELRQGRACPEPLATLEAIWIRYTVHGMRHERRVPFSELPAVRCGLTAGR